LQRYAEDQQMVRHHFHQCRQDRHETMQSYADRFRKLAARARCTEGTEVLTRFLSGLTPDMYDRVLSCRPSTFDEALQHCLYFERMLRIRQRPEHPRMHEVDRNRPPRPTAPDRWWQGAPQRAHPPEPPTARPAPHVGAHTHGGQGGDQAVNHLTRDMSRLQISAPKPPTCYACGQVGHISSRCPNKSPPPAHRTEQSRKPRMMVRLV
jgi:hypothetical protein